MGKKSKSSKSSPEPEKMLSGRAPGDVLRRYGLIVVISAWMFILGVLVGRGTAPIKFDIENLHHKLAARGDTMDNEPQSRFKIASKGMPDKKELEFYEALKKTDDAKTVEPAADPGAGHADAVPHKTAALKKPEKRPQVFGTAPAARADKSDTSSRKTAGGGEYTIQVASMKDGNMCDTMVSTLRKKGYPAYRTRGNIPGRGVWFRVRVGSFKTRDAAAQTMQRLKKAKFKPMVIRNRPVS